MLRMVDVNYLTRGTCNSNRYDYRGDILASMFCAAAAGKDSCQGDSGGPLTYTTPSGNDVQMGVVSWGYGCADADAPGVYAKVSHFNSWIQSTTGEQFCSV